MERGVRPHPSTYRVLNERATESLVSKLEGTPCIYVENQRRFVRTNQVYWAAQQLGQYTFKIPESMKSWTPLFRAIGVKDVPDCSDYVDILLDIVESHSERSAEVMDPDRTVYDTCLAAVAAAHEREECSATDLRRLKERPTILNLVGKATFPDEILLHDSEWHAGFFGRELEQALCRLPAELCALAETLGVRRLSESATVSLEYVDGPKQDETELAETLMDRTDIFARLLHEETAMVRERVRNALSAIKAVSYDDVRIEVSVVLMGDAVSAPSTPAPAFYDLETGQLTVRRPVNDRSWAHVLNALFHQLMPGATGGQVSKLTLVMRPLMGMAVEEAHRELTDARVPPLDRDPGRPDSTHLTSQELGELGVGDEQADGEKIDEAVPPSQAERGTVIEDGDGDPLDDEREGEQGSENSRRAADPRPRGARPKKRRQIHKQLWDRRLLSYVRQKLAEAPEGEDGSKGSSGHNLAVESVARDAVCAYERARGRFAEQMAQGHPGYDIVSRNPLTEEQRFIEVKGVAGEWNQTGVGLSKLQFSNAQNYGDRYWLYVVEFASDPEHVRVHAIRNPATQVTAFMFDGNWRQAATDEQDDPTLRFMPGVRVHHESLGAGEIRDVVVRGSSKLLTIRFEGKNQDTPHVPLNLHQMRILEDGDDDDSP